jgi:hypothetical protein
MFYLDDQDPDDGEDEDVDSGQDESSEEGQNDSESESGSGEQSSSSSQGGTLRNAAKNKISKARKNGKILSNMKQTRAMSWVARVILPVLPYVIGIIVIIIILIGLIMFLLMLPGILMGKINELLDKAAGFFVSIWQSDAETAVTDQSVIDVAEYLEKMGYDLREYGFVTSPVTEAVSSQIDISDEEKERAFIDTNGIGRTDSAITNINSEVIRTYLLSDNYVYCCRNFNKNIKTAFSSVGTFLSGLFVDDIAWGDGLITIYQEQTSFWGKGKVGLADASYKNHWYSKEDISVDSEAKTLIIKTKTGFAGLGKGRSFTYKLDGWTARYGMPIEFLLAVHITSMSPDLAVDLATSFDTEVVILLHKSNATVTIGYKCDDGSMVASDTFLPMVSGYVTRATAAKALQAFGIDNPNCTNDPKCYIATYKDSSDKEQKRSESCENCQEFVRSIKSDFNKLKAKNFETLVPYISKVTDHWFRDVYFVAETDTEVINNDEDYEAETGERWTKYETTTDDDGNVSYVLYLLNDDGTIATDDAGTEIKYDGTSEDAKRDGINVTKKAITSTVADIAEDGTLQSSWFSGYWTAYSTDTTTTDWEKYEVTPDSEQLNNPDNIYYKTKTEDNIVQVQDGQRGVTNSKIKKIFSTNKYYTYDGTAERAEAIEEDKEKTASKREYDNTENDARDPDLISSFSVTRDSLTAFNILENMNTFDADSIYRDFKELIVELNYFDKEDLTETSSVVWEWVVPDTGSGGWPIKRYEKLEDVYGTLINSEVDLTNLQAVDKAKQVLTGSGDADLEDGDGEEAEVAIAEKSTDIFAITDSMGSESFITNKNTTNISDMLKSGSFSGSTFLETAKNCWEYIVDAGRYSYAGASVPVNNGSTVDCSSYVSWVLYEYGFEDFKGGQHTASQFYETDWEAAYGWQQIDVAAGEDCSSELQAGDILVRYGNGTHHVQIIKEIEPDGTIITYDCGNSTHWVSSNRDGFSYTSFAKSTNAPGKIIRIENQTSYGSPFSGYGPYEDVVSPVTGQIIEAGITTITNIETNVEEDVGYIKIKVLDESDFTTYFDSEDEELEGYQYFYNDYEKAGVTGEILYIEGFDLRIVDEDLNLLDDSAIKDEETGDYKNRYTKDTYEDVLSDDAREALEEKEDKRDEAKPIYQTSDGKLFIKEGTVIGKTYTDGDANTNVEVDADADEETEIPEDAKVRPGIANIPEDQKTYTDADGNEIDMPNGNYIRLILRTAEDGSDATSNKDSVIENVEDYLEVEAGIATVGGDTFVMPEEVLEAQSGSQITYEAINRSDLGFAKDWSSGSSQRAIYELWASQQKKATNGSTTSESLAAGAAVVSIGGKDYIVVALKSAFGNVGDYVQITFENGAVIDAIIGDAKGTDSGSFMAVGDHGEIDYGHSSNRK